jgi:hypothetical protein
MTQDQHITAFMAAREVYEQLLISYHTKDRAAQSVRLEWAHEEFAKLAAALGYRVEKIEARDAA